MIATAQQINTLLYYLTHKQTPPFDVRFWSNLQKIDFDYSAYSIKMLSRLFAAMAKRQFQLADLLAQKDGQAFVVTVAAYIADYLAKTTGQSIKWYDYAAITKEVAHQNAPQHSYLPLSATFDCALTACIGQKVYCQPLQLVPKLLNGDDVLPQYITQMTQTLYQQSRVNLLQAPDDVCRDYLAKVKTGSLHDPMIGWGTYLAAVKFDYSRASLAQIDDALEAIAQDFSFTRDDYLAFLQAPSNQAFCYLLGFYIGVTSSRLANVPVRWANFEQMYASLGEEFALCIEHSFVLLLEGGYHTPIRVVTNRLFGLASEFLTTAVAFADRLQVQPLSQIRVYSYQPDVIITETILPHWQQAMQAAGTVVASALAQVWQGEPVLPCLYQAKCSDALGAIELSEIVLLQGKELQAKELQGKDTDAIIDGLYQTLYHNPQAAPMRVACFDSYVNLPMGRTEGIVIEVRVYTAPILQLQLILPYQSANTAHSLKIYPVVSHQKITQDGTNLTAEQMAALTQCFYQAAINAQLADTIALKTLWQAAYINQLDYWAQSPKDRWLEQQTTQLVDTFDFPLLPLATNQTTINVSAASQFDYSAINWHGVDVASALSQLPTDEQTYLQVFASDDLIKDELYRQAEATDHLYRYGKVVWGIVIDCDEALTQPLTDDERDKPFTNRQIHRADILFDPTGQVAVADLQSAAHQLLAAVKTLDIQHNAQGAPDVAFYQLHRQDHRSRVFNLLYPPSVAAVDYRISSSWIWRRHLPNGMLSSKVVPIIIDLSNGGEIMVLPSQLWDKSYYHHWLSLAYQQFGQDYDLWPYINWQQRHGQNINNDLAIQKRLFPKIKSIPTTATARASKAPSSFRLQTQTQKQIQAQTLPTTAAVDLPDIIHEHQSPKPQSALSNRAVNQTLDLPKSTDQPLLSDGLMQQLLIDKHRLQTQLSTQDKHKEKKIMLIVGSVIIVLIIALIMGIVMR